MNWTTGKEAVGGQWMFEACEYVGAPQMEAYKYEGNPFYQRVNAIVLILLWGVGHFIENGTSLCI